MAISFSNEIPLSDDNDLLNLMAALNSLKWEHVYLAL